MRYLRAAHQSGFPTGARPFGRVHGLKALASVLGTPGSRKDARWPQHIACPLFCSGAFGFMPQTESKNGTGVNQIDDSAEE